MRNKFALSGIITLLIIFITFPASTYVGNKAITLDGDGDYILVPSSSSLTFSDGITIEAWVRIDTLSRNQIIVHKKNSYYNDIWCGLDSSNRLEWLFRIDGSERDIRHNYSFTAGTWYHIAYTYDALTGIGRTYVNGDKVGEIWTYGQLTFNDTDGWYLGVDTDGSSLNDYWNGDLDDVRIWNIAKTQTEIQALMNVSLSGNETGLVAYWKLDEAPGTSTAADATPNGNDGTLQGNADFFDSTGNPLQLPSSDQNIHVFPTDLTFCEMRVGETRELSLEIANSGQTDLQVTNIQSNNTTFVPMPTSATVPSFSSFEISVQFTPTAPGTETGTLTISSDDTDTPSVNVNLSGDGATTVNRTAVFDDNNDFVQVIKDIPETNLTIEFWFKTTDPYGGLFGVEKGWLGNNGHDRHIYINDGYMKQRVYNNETITSQSSGFNDDQWHHYAMVIEKGVGQKMYIDGQLEASGSKDHSDFTDQDRFVFGYSNDRGWYSGVIDEVRIWKIPLSKASILAFKDRILTGNESGLIGNWRLDDCPNQRFAKDKTNFQATGFLFDNTNLVNSARTETPVIAEQDIFVEPSSLDFGDVQVGQYAEQTFDIVNRGQNRLTVSDITSSDAQLFVSPEPFPEAITTQSISLEIPYGTTQRIRVRYKPSSISALNATLTITSNDPDSPTNITVTGNGVGYNNKAVSFDGDNDYIEIPYSSSMRPDKWTMEVWVKLNSFDVDRRGIMGSGWSYRDFYIGTKDQKFFAWIYRDSDNYGEIYSTFQPNTDQWYHLAASYDGSVFSFYVDGVLQGTSSKGWSKDERSFYFGRTAGGEYINGVIDEACFWNMARSPQEINATMGSLLPEDATGLVGYWRFDESAGMTVAQDFTSNGNRGTVYGNTDFIASDAPIQEAPLSPGVVISPLFLDFDKVTIGDFAERSLIIFNKGQQVLQIENIQPNKPEFEVLNRSFPLAWGERKQINIRFTPDSEGYSTDRVLVRSNDPGTAKSFSLLGIGRTYFNRALKLDGDGDMVSVPHDTSLDLDTVTVEMWVKPGTDLTGKDVSFIRKERYSDTCFILEQLYDQEDSNTEELFMWVNNGSSWYKNNRAAYNTFAFAPGEWYHLAATYDGSLIQLFVNGRLLATRRYTGGTGDSNINPVYIGSNGNGRWFDGLIDDVRIFDYARTQAEIVSTMNLTLTGDEPGLVAYWPFDDQPTSSKADDASGNGLSGTLSGNAYFVDSDAPTSLPSQEQDIAVFPSTVEFGTVMQNSSTEKNLIIINRGQSTLQITGIQSADAQVTPRMTAFPLLSGEKMEVPLVFNPTTIGDFSADLTITSDDPDSATVVVNMSATVLDTAPASNWALELDGSSDYVSIPDSDSLDLTDNFTLEAWVFLTASNDRIILGKHEAYEWDIDDGTVWWRLWTDGGWDWKNTGVKVEYNQWTHLALIYSSPDVQIYKNGILSNTTSDSQGGDLGTNENELRIGSYGYSNGGYWYSGQLDEVRMWNDVRTEEEIRDNMFAMLTGTEPNLVGYWPFSADADDFSSQGNDGTLRDNATTVETDLPLPPEKGDVNRNGLISELDAVMILQASLGFIDLPAIEFFAADVTNNLRVTAYDASLVMKYIVGDISSFPAPSVDTPSIESVIANLQNMNFVKPEIIQIPITISEMTDVLSAQIMLKYDTSRLEPVRVLKTDLTSDYQLAYEAQNGELRISLANSEATSGNGNIVIVEFRALQLPLQNRHNSVRLVNVMLNEGSNIFLQNNTPIPEETKLLANYPNPFNPETWIPYLLADGANVNIRIYNINGQLVRQLDLGKQRAGSYIARDKAVYWDGNNEFGEAVASGIYFYTLQAGSVSKTRQMVILK